MTSEMGETFNAWRDHKKEMRAKHGVKCDGCIQNYPKREPTILMPGQRCKVCGYQDPREHVEMAVLT